VPKKLGGRPRPAAQSELNYDHPSPPQARRVRRPAARPLP